MAVDFDQMTRGARLAGVLADGDVTVVDFERQGEQTGVLIYKGVDGQMGERIITADDLARISVASACRWSFDADGADFRLASEARRMRWAHLADPFTAVDTSNIEPYPHQIDAVYNRFLEQRPLRFLLADDPGAGKTIMSGLLIRELIIRGDVARCLVVAPGSLVEQWQDELWERFGLEFDIMDRSTVESSRTGNPFAEKHMLIARIDQLARSEDLTAKLEATDWDLVIVDEAHKMSAHRYGRELKKTKRFQLGETLRDHTRHLLLLSATPHNGKPADFAAFLTLIDAEQFAGRFSDGELPATDGVMRRLVKENLRTFEGRPLFPKRHAHTLNFELSEAETELYEAVTSYVREGMNRAARMASEGDKRRGIIIGFALAGLQRRLASSPDAIYHSLRRRKERLEIQADSLRALASTGEPIPVPDLPRGVRFADLEDFDFDDFDDEEMEDLEIAVDSATAAATAEEIEVEVAELGRLVDLAHQVRISGVDTKWVQLRDLLRNDPERDGDNPSKLIVFSEHKDTLAYVAQRIADELGRPEAVVTIHGGVKRHDRRVIQERFRVDPTVQVLVATDAAGEGVNLQVANRMVNYDLPWNPNRIEQRFGRIHRIGQDRPCHLWNLVAYETREGQVFQRLFAKIEAQRQTFGDQVYDVLGDSHINTSLQELLIKAIRDDHDPAHAEYMAEVIDGEIGAQLTDVLEQRALSGDVGVASSNDKIRDLMESARARKLQPWFVEAFFTEALKRNKGNITGREPGRFEITRVPASIRADPDPTLGTVHDRYHRVTFDKNHVSLEGGPNALLVSPGTALLTAVINKVMADHGGTLSSGATLLDPDDPGTEPRLLVYLDHEITDGRQVHGHRQLVSRRFQYVEIDQQGQASDAGGEPYLDLAPLTEEQRNTLDGHLDIQWADDTAEGAARSWAIEHLAAPHFAEVEAFTTERVTKVRVAVKERLSAEIRYWDQRTEELKAQQLKGKKPSSNPGQARARADALEARLTRRRLELDREVDLASAPPKVVAAALVVPQGLLDQLDGAAAHPAEPHADPMETDRRAVAAVMAAERALGRNPTSQAHANPGFDIESVDPETGIHYFIEVKGHLPRTEEISVSATQVQKAKSNPDRWRLAVASVPDDPKATPTVRYLVEPFANVTLHFAQTKVPLAVKNLLAESSAPC